MKPAAVGIHQLLKGMVKTFLTCNHGRTPIHEGKCFCPDCGHGLIFQWVVLRCGQCNSRRNSRYFLRQIVPVEHSCPKCGEESVRWDYLDSPTYFQLHKACLVIQEEEEYLTRFAWPSSSWLRSKIQNKGVEARVAIQRQWQLFMTPSPALLPAKVSIVSP